MQVLLDALDALGSYNYFLLFSLSVRLAVQDAADVAPWFRFESRSKQSMAQYGVCHSGFLWCDPFRYTSIDLSLDRKLSCSKEE